MTSRPCTKSEMAFSELQQMARVAEQGGGTRAERRIRVPPRWRFLDRRVGGQAEIILRSEVDAGNLGAAVRSRRAVGFRRGGRGFGVGPQVVAPAQVLPREAFDAANEIGADRRAIIAQAAGQRGFGNGILAGLPIRFLSMHAPKKFGLQASLMGYSYAP